MPNNTQYSEVYDKFFLKVKDYNFPLYSEEIKEEYLLDLLTSSIDDFSDFSVKDLSQRDDASKSFNVILSGREKEILAIGMAFHWVEAKFLDEDAMRNSMSTRDYSYHSPANLFKELKDAREQMRIALYREQYLYSYRTGEIGGGANGAV